MYEMCSELTLSFQPISSRHGKTRISYERRTKNLCVVLYDAQRRVYVNIFIHEHYNELEVCGINIFFFNFPRYHTRKGMRATTESEG